MCSSTFSQYWTFSYLLKSAIYAQVAKGYKYIYTIDDDCFVAKNPTGDDINVLEQHIRNLLTPSTPFFFNTLYDPYAPGSDFVRGYPFSMREGVPTAVSHGKVLFDTSLLDHLLVEAIRFA